MMTPREVVTRAIEFRRPARLPIAGYGEHDDCLWMGEKSVKPAGCPDDPAVDQWSCGWAKTEVKNMGQVKEHPLTDLDDMADFPWPDADDPRRYDEIDARLRAIADDPLRRDKYSTAEIFMILWERMHSLHGFENCLMALAEGDPRIHELADRILDYQMRYIRNLHRIAGDRIQGFAFSEDWGSETDLFISPALFRDFFLPRYKKLFGLMRDCGWHVLMHSCGKINKALPMLIEAGLHVINMQQPRANGIEEIGRDFAGKVCFMSLCDIQTTLPRGDRAAIEEEAGLLLRHWGTPDGGFILGDYGDAEAIGTVPETKQFMLETFLRLDPYRKDRERKVE